MRNRLKDEAEAIVIGLELGSVQVMEAVSWADQAILLETAPHWSLCEIALMTNKHPLDVAAMLRNVPGQADMNQVKSLVIERLLFVLESKGKQSTSIFSNLYRFTNFDNGTTYSDLYDVAEWAERELDLIEDHCSSLTPEEVVTEACKMLRACK